MKIGILTYHSVYNFGANLQVYSTVAYLEKSGYQPRVINLVPKDLEGRYDLSTPKEQVQAHKSFQSTYLPMTKVCRNAEEIADCLKEEGIESVIVGSDSLFNLQKPSINWLRLKRNYPTSDHKFPNPFWAEFVNHNPNILAMGLSISSQNSNYFAFEKEREAIGKSLENFKYVSVRDDWTKKLVEYYSSGKISPSVTPDPVFGFNQNVNTVLTKDEVLKKFKLPENYFLLSFTGGRRTSAKADWLQEFEKEANGHGVSCAQLARTSGGQNLGLEYSVERPLTPIDWYYLIKYSRGYIGVLMHPIVVAIHNSVPFFSFDHYGIKKGLKLKKESSKTYHIIKKGDLLSQHFSLDLLKPFPSAKKVVDSLINFDHDKCSAFAIQQQKEYEENMKRILGFVSDQS